MALSFSENLNIVSLLFFQLFCVQNPYFWLVLFDILYLLYTMFQGFV